MNKLKQKIATKENYIGHGAARVAFRDGMYVYKFSYRPIGRKQFVNEKKALELIPNYYKSLFPEPTFITNTIMRMRFVQPIDEIVGYYSDEVLDDIIAKNLATSESINLFLNFLKRANEFGVDADDLMHNGSNIGISNYEIKIVDWGTAQGEDWFCGNPDYYHRLSSWLELS